MSTFNKPTDPPAFPTGTGVTPYSPGMTLRDYFAARVLQAYESRQDLDDLKVIDKAKRSYHIADAMLEARK